MMATVNPSGPLSSDQTVLFRHPGGARVRLMARSAGTVGLLVAVTAAATVMRAASLHGLTQLSRTSLMVAGGIGLCGVAFAWLSCRFSRRFVTHLEIWPRSNLALVRSAGCWREKLRLIGWNEFRTSQAVHRSTRGDPLLWVQLRSGRRLAFDLERGEAPNGWVALHRFLEKCSVPEPVVPAPLGVAEKPLVGELRPS